MTVYMRDIHEIKKHAQVKMIFAFQIESVSRCFLIHYIYTVHAIVVKRDDVRTRYRNVLCIVPYIHQYIAQACLKILLEMIHVIDDSNHMAFICFALFCVASKMIVL